MTEFDLEKMTTEEVAANILDRLRIDIDGADLENTAPDAESMKFLEAIRLIAKEDPQTLADGFFALSIDVIQTEAELEFVRSFALRSLMDEAGVVGCEGDDIDPSEVN